MRIDKAERAALKEKGKIDQAQFAERLHELVRQVPDPRAGFFGPGSVTWMVSREAVLFATGMCPLLLQVAHPKVAQSVADFSQFRTQPLGRAYRTFDAVFRIVFGSVDTASHVAGHVYRMHTAFAGTLDDPVPSMTKEYYAADPEVALWIYATLIHTAFHGYQMFVGPIPESMHETYYRESKIFGILFGVTDEVFPVDFKAFHAYWDDMIHGDQLVVTPTGRAVAHALMFNGPLALRPTSAVFNAVGASLMPERLVQDFGMKWGWKERKLAAATIKTLQTITPRIPAAYRATPAARMAERRTGLRHDDVGFLDDIAVQMAEQAAKALG